MAITCNDIEKLVYPYLDGEFSGEDQDALETHLDACGACRGAVESERRFKDALRAKLPNPRSGSDLPARVRAALDEVDRETRDVMPAWERVLHQGAIVAAAAAIALFALYPRAPAPAPAAREAPTLASTAPVAAAPRAGSATAFVKTHMQRPIEVAAPDELPAGFNGQLGVNAAAPDFRGEAAIRRAWINEFEDRRALQLEYVTRGLGDRGRVFSVHVFDPTGIHVRGTLRRVGDELVRTGNERGVNFVYFIRNGVGYAYTSELGHEELLRLVRASQRP